jgi:hypothetical protein
VREFPHLTAHEEILGATKALNPWQQAGFVVRDASGSRIKYLSPQYMAFFFAMGWQNKGASVSQHSLAADTHAHMHAHAHAHADS